MYMFGKRATSEEIMEEKLKQLGISLEKSETDDGTFYYVGISPEAYRNRDKVIDELLKIADNEVIEQVIHTINNLERLHLDLIGGE